MNSTSLKTIPASSLIKIGFVANVLEWFEFVTYNFLVAIMGINFLPEQNPIISVIQAYFLFAITYLARPLGSFFYGYLGDTVGRGYALKGSLLTMAIPTALIGLLPTYHQVGWIATISLVALRLIQGFATGGELPISACYVFENAPIRWRSFLCSTVSAGSSIGILLSSTVVTLLFRYFTESEIIQWAWRIPYLLSIPMAIWIFYVRSAIDQVPVANTVESQTTFRIKEFVSQTISTLSAIKYQFLPLVLLVGFMETGVYMLLFWMPSYLEQFLNVPAITAQTTNTLMLVTYIGFSLLSGYLSGILGYKRLLTFHIFGILALTYPLFQGLQIASYPIFLAIHIIFAWLLSGVVSVMMEVLGSTLHQGSRAFGMSITHTLAATFFGGMTPGLCHYFTHRTGNPLFPAFYMMGFAAVALLLAIRLPNRETTDTIR